MNSVINRSLIDAQIIPIKGLNMYPVILITSASNDNRNGGKKVMGKNAITIIVEVTQIAINIAI
jgi:hypothetical protein